MSTMDCQKDLTTEPVPELPHVESGNLNCCSKEDTGTLTPVHVKDQEEERDVSMLDDSFSFSANKSDWKSDDFYLKNYSITSQVPSSVKSGPDHDTCFPFVDASPSSTDAHFESASGKWEIMPQTKPKDYCKELDEKVFSNTAMKKREQLYTYMEQDDPTMTKSDCGLDEPPATVTTQDSTQIPLPIGPSPPPLKFPVTLFSAPITSTSSPSQETSPKAQLKRNYKREIFLENARVSPKISFISSSRHWSRKYKEIIKEENRKSSTPTKTNEACNQSSPVAVLSKQVTSSPSFTFSRANTLPSLLTTQSTLKSVLVIPSSKKSSSFQSGRYSNGSSDRSLGSWKISSLSCESSAETEQYPAALEQRSIYRYLPDYDANPWLPSDVQLVDTHCHLDFLFKRSETRSYQLRSLSDYRWFKPKCAFPPCYEGCVAVFCEPSVYSMPNYYTRILAEDGVWGAFGVHPHHAHKYNVIIEDELCRALENENVRALGEIGLDYSNRNACPHYVQHQVFRQQLKIAIKRNLPLVIHCRDAEDDCLSIMKELVPRTHKIHRHCFTGPWSEARRWLREFPNLYIGLTPVVTYPSAKTVHEVAACIPLDRLVLETDAPYFIPQKVSKWECPHSYPGLVIHAASQIASLRNMNLAELLRVVRKNTTQVYGI